MIENDYIERNQEFFKLLFCIVDFNAHLTEREIKYLLWRFHSKMTAEEIAKHDGKRISRSAVNQVMESAYKKIRLKTLDK